MRRTASGIVALVIGVSSAAAQRTSVGFEVASIKTVEPLNIQKVVSGEQPPASVTQTPGRVDIIGHSLGMLLTTAFRVRPDQIAGPDWLALDAAGQLNSGEPRFDIHATLPAGSRADQIPEMLQLLLADRFKLAFHRERRDQSRLALVVGRDGPKLTRSSPSDADSPRQSQRVVTGANIVRIERDRLTMGQLASLLAGLFKRPVVDMTNLSGTYKVSLDLSPEDLLAMAPQTAGQAFALPADPGGNLSALRSIEQLGLKLESRTAAVDYIVIEHLEKLPTPD